jgi:hypothetical protein
MSGPKNQSLAIEQQLRRYERTLQPTAGENGVFSTGIAALDALLPDGGISRGTLMEWLSEKAGGGAGTLAFTVAAQLMRADGACVVIDPAGTFYPPAIGKLADDFQRMIVVHPANGRDALWALEQSLCCRGVAVVVCRLGHAFERELHHHAYRRLQLAAETGGAIGLLLRPARYRVHPTWADVRLLVEPLCRVGEEERGGKRLIADREFRISDFLQSEISENPQSGHPRQWGIRNPKSPLPTGRRLQVELLHCRGRSCGGIVKLEIDDETGDVRLASGLAAATNTTRRAAGA